MESKFSEAVRKAISNSRLECLALGYGKISPEMLILGLVRDQDVYLNGAVRALQLMGVDIDSMCKALEGIIRSSPPKSNTSSNKDIPFNNDAEMALKRSFLTAKTDGFSDQVNTVHLLIAALEGFEHQELIYLQKNTGLDLKNLRSHIYLDGWINNTGHPKEEESIEEQLKASKERILELKSLSEKIRITDLPAPSSPLSIYFNMNEYTQEEVKEVILLLAELYHHHSGDNLVIKGMSQFDVVNHLACV